MIPLAKHSVVGKQFGELTVLEELEPHITPNGSLQRIIKVCCSCGNIYETRLTSAQKSRMCKACLDKKRRQDITGQRFGKLIVTSMADDYISPSGHRLSRCNCLCDCGNTCVVNMSALITGATTSCGCTRNSRGLLKDNQHLVDQYDFEKNKDLDLEFDKLTAASNVKVWWKCNKCGNSWLATISSQNDKHKKHGCPYCSGRFVIKGKNDLLSQHPDVVAEWDYNKNAIGPDEVFSNSTKKVWWKCKEGHEWRATIANRVRGSGCPRCNIENVNSFCEQAVYYYISRYFRDAINSDMSIGMELDIYIPSIKAAIEYDGEAWHSTQKKIRTDVKKNRVCDEKGITLIRIREPRIGKLENCVCFVRKDSTTNETLDTVIKEVLQYLGVQNADVDTTSDSGKIMAQFATKKYKNSLSYCYPEVAAEWHPTRNGGLTPDRVNKKARLKAWWLGKCGHEWQMTVSARTRDPAIRKVGKRIKGQGCPYCAGKKILIGFNDLQSQYPEIATEWHPTKNGDLKPIDVMPGSKKKVWWLGKCGHEWQAVISARCKSRQGCPLCFQQKKSPAVICIETGKVFNHGTEASAFLGLKTAASIYKCCRGEIKTASGYHWKYFHNSDK